MKWNNFESYIRITINELLEHDSFTTNYIIYDISKSIELFLFDESRLNFLVA